MKIEYIIISFGRTSEESTVGVEPIALALWKIAPEQKNLVLFCERSGIRIVKAILHAVNG